MQTNRDQRIVEHILDYCIRIDETVSYFNRSKEVFNENHVFRDAVALCVLQIGELTGVLSNEMKKKYVNIQWRQIKALRNIVAHKYGTVDTEVLWEILTSDVPQLQSDCEKILGELQDSEQHVQEDTQNSSEDEENK